MSRDNRLLDDLDQRTVILAKTSRYVQGMTRDAFLLDERTQDAVLMTLVAAGEVASIVKKKYPLFVEQQTSVPWAQITGLRNRIAHGYFEINTVRIWDAVVNHVPKLEEHLLQLKFAAKTHVETDASAEV